MPMLRLTRSKFFTKRKFRRQTMTLRSTLSVECRKIIPHHLRHSRFRIVPCPRTIRRCRRISMKHPTCVLPLRHRPTPAQMRRTSIHRKQQPQPLSQLHLQRVLLKVISHVSRHIQKPADRRFRSITIRQTVSRQTASLHRQVRFEKVFFVNPMSHRQRM